MIFNEFTEFAKQSILKQRPTIIMANFENFPYLKNVNVKFSQSLENLKNPKSTIPSSLGSFL